MGLLMKCASIISAAPPTKSPKHIEWAAINVLPKLYLTTIFRIKLNYHSILPLIDRGTYLTATIGESAFANYEPDANTMALWHLEEMSGSGAYIKDSSGKSNNGTPTNGPYITDEKLAKVIILMAVMIILILVQIICRQALLRSVSGIKLRHRRIRLFSN